jgi:RimJ/RimL family protein N-acetyltransferase
MNDGYGSEGYKLLVDFLLRSTNLFRIGMLTWSENIRMIQLAEEIKMKEEARIRDARWIDGGYFDVIKMGVSRDEWEKSKGN